jgi:hypothetical protein
VPPAQADRSPSSPMKMNRDAVVVPGSRKAVVSLKTCPVGAPLPRFGRAVLDMVRSTATTNRSVTARACQTGEASPTSDCQITGLASSGRVPAEVATTRPSSLTAALWCSSSHWRHCRSWMTAEWVSCSLPGGFEPPTDGVLEARGWCALPLRSIPAPAWCCRRRGTSRSGCGRRHGPSAPPVLPLRLGASTQDPAGATTLMSSADRIRALHVHVRKPGSGGQSGRRGSRSPAGTRPWEDEQHGRLVARVRRLRSVAPHDLRHASSVRPSTPDSTRCQRCVRTVRHGDGWRGTAPRSSPDVVSDLVAKVHGEGCR